MSATRTSSSDSAIPAIVDWDAADAEVAFAADEAGEVEQKRCFAGAVAANHHQKLAGGAAQRETAEQLPPARSR